MIGRDDELTLVLQALERGRVTTVRGPPGVGKTTLARAVTKTLAARAVSAVLDHATSRRLVLERLATAAGLRLRSRDVRVTFSRLAEHLDQRALVVVLDGVDAVAEVTASVVGDLLDATERARFLTCAFSPLGLPDEHVVPLSPLPAEAAVELLRHHVLRLAPHRALSPADATALMVATNGLPLAVELVAARVAALGADAVLSEVRARGVSGAPLDTAIGAAFSLLSKTDARALTALSVFRASFDAPAARAVIDGGLDVLERLSLASLVQVEGNTYRLLDSVRDFASRQSTQVRDDARARHAAFLAQPQPARADEVTTWATLMARRDDLLSAWEWAREHHPALTATLAVTLDPLLITQGPEELHRRVLLDTLSLPSLEPSLRIDLLLSLGRVDAIRGRFREALTPFEQALRLAEANDGDGRIGWSHAFLCFALRPLGRFDEARAHGLQALEFAKTTRDHRLVAMGEQALGRLAHAEGDLDAATAAQRRAQTAAALAKAPRLEGIASCNLGETLEHRGDVDGAREALARGRAVFASIHDEFHLARLAVHEARLSMQAPALLRALEAVVDLDDLEGELEAREGLVRAAMLANDARLTATRLDELEVAARFTDDVSWPKRVRALKERPLSGPTALKLRVSRDGRQVQLGDEHFDFSRRGPLRRVLVALVETRLHSAGRPLSASDVQEAGWPGEKMFPESAAARVYMAIRRLRELGLGVALRTVDEGYLLDTNVDVGWLDPAREN
ncbi:MAG: AAA family ATPase [Myxococcaceae bacterium]